MDVPAAANAPAIHALMWTPCAVSPGKIIIEKILDVPGVRDCPIMGNNLPLIIVSHGGGSDPIVHHDTAEKLADAGFVVVALRHPNDSAGGVDNSWFIERPTDVQRVLDYALRSSPAAEKIDPSRIGFFGFSRGGYTGLMLTGAIADYPFWLKSWIHMAVWAFHPDMPIQPSARDLRFKAFVIADSVTLFPDRESLRNVTAPLQLWSSQSGGQRVTPEKVAAVARDLPTKPEFHLVPNSTHSSFGMPCPATVAKVAGDFCADPPGFDRAAFHQQFDAQVLAFFSKNLPE